MSQPSKQRNSRAFTLVELIVVMVIMAIAAAMAAPYAIDTGSAGATAAARIITCDLQFAQDEAITSQVPVTVAFSTAGESYSLSNASGALIHPINKTSYVIDFNALRGLNGVDVVSASFGGGSSVTFDELGSPDNAGNVTVQCGSDSYVVNVAAATGKVTVSAGGA